jgi:8-oxo-dGTP diphosphatase
MEKFSYEYPRAALTVDGVVFGYDAGELKILLIKRALEPYRGQWALPGGFVRVDESLDEAARRELEEETGLRDIYLEQLYTFGALTRDPRERIVSVAYYALVKSTYQIPQANTDAEEARWFALSDLPVVAFDHADIIDCAWQRLRAKLRYEPIGFELLPAAFTLTQLQQLYETILDTDLDKRNFRKKMLSHELLLPLKNKMSEGLGRPAQLYRFDLTRYERLKKKGFFFEL